MNGRQKYLFDLQGFLLIEDVLSQADCALAIEKIKSRAKPMERTPDAQKCYFNLAYQAFGPPENPRNDQPQFS